ncbi:hypothetical protein WJX74_001232 [Apatococcus lobatus]|uniref:tRNA modification GTPase n=1 Tax=Apatococcus lobatus TaxID=904363 RepID=A0AAW1SEV4_9CHLO
MLAGEKLFRASRALPKEPRHCCNSLWQLSRTGVCKNHQTVPCLPAAPAQPAAVTTSLQPAAETVVLSTAGEETIAAIVTGPAQEGAVAIIRISGLHAMRIAMAVFQPGHKPQDSWRPRSHRVYHGHACNASGGVIDEVLMLPMLAPRSYTAENVVELHTHGGGVCAKAVLQRCIEVGARLAKPGEFTLRAFLNGRLDLSQAESVAQLVSARTPAAAGSALAGLQGGIGSVIGSLRSEAIELLAEFEARLDFDEDMPELSLTAAAEQVARLRSQVMDALSTARQGHLLRSGLQVAIVGRPNVGKSSILNRWSNSQRAIVTEIAGTTRDVVEAGAVVGGVPVTLLDTAGIREASDAVERMGVERSRAAALAADIVVMVIDAQEGWTPADNSIFQQLWHPEPIRIPGRHAAPPPPRVSGTAVLVCNKTDLLSSTPAASASAFHLFSQPHARSSAAPGLDEAAASLSSGSSPDADSNCMSGATDGDQAGAPFPRVSRLHADHQSSVAAAKLNSSLDLHASLAQATTTTTSTPEVLQQGLQSQAVLDPPAATSVWKTEASDGLSEQASDLRRPPAETNACGSGPGSNADLADRSHAGILSPDDGPPSRSNPSCIEHDDSSVSSGPVPDSGSNSITSSHYALNASSAPESSVSDLDGSRAGIVSNPYAQAGCSSRQSSELVAETYQPASSEACAEHDGAVESNPLPDLVRAAFADVVSASTLTEAGVQGLEAAVLTAAGAPALAQGGASWAVNDRQAEALTRADEALGRLQESIQAALPLDFWTIDLREAVAALGEVNGTGVSEEVLDSVFARFCIGK